MKIETITQTVYVSDDGMHYDTEEDCLKHEWEMKASLWDAVNSIPHDIIVEAQLFPWNDCWCYGYLFIRPRNKAEIDYLKEWLKQFKKFDTLELTPTETYICEAYFADDVNLRHSLCDIENINDVWSFADFMSELNSPFYTIKCNLKRVDWKEYTK